MKILVLLKPVAGKEISDFLPHMVAEIEAVWAAYKDNSLREYYFQPDPQIVTLIYELPDVAAVNSALDSLPMVVAGLLDRQVVQLGPFMQFEALFDKTSHAIAS